MLVIVANVKHTVGVALNWPITIIVIAKLSSSYRYWNPSYPVFCLVFVGDGPIVNLVVCQKTVKAGGVMKVIECDLEHLESLFIEGIVSDM